jgi:hypothetical protein
VLPTELTACYAAVCKVLPTELTACYAEGMLACYMSHKESYSYSMLCGEMLAVAHSMLGGVADRGIACFGGQLVLRPHLLGGDTLLHLCPVGVEMGGSRSGGTGG